MARLPAGSKECLKFVSALSTPTVDIIEMAIGHGRASAGLARSMEARVLVPEADRLRFAHPLLASFVYSDLSVEQRRQTHARLAEVVTDNEERARHIALAATHADEAVASIVEDGGERALARGAPVAAAELLEKAYRLTPVELPDERRRRALRAEGSFEVSGMHTPALRLCEEILADWPEHLPRGRILMEIGDVAGSTDARNALVYYDRAIAESAGDPVLEAVTGIRISHTLAWIGRYPDAEAHAAAALRRAEATNTIPLIASALSRLAFDRGIQGGGLRTDLMARFDAIGWTDPVWTYTVVRDTFPTVLTWADRLGEAKERLLRLRRIYGERGADLAIFDVVTRLSYVESLSGNYLDASALAKEADELLWEPDDGNRFRSLSPWALAEAHLGRVESARAKAERAVELGSRTNGESSMSTLSGVATLGFLELSLGDPVAAHEQLGRATGSARVLGIGEPGAMRFVPDEVEVLVSLGEVDHAESLLEWWEERSRALDRTYGLATSGRCRGLLSARLGDVAGALASLEHAIVHHAGIPDQPFELARTLLVLGQVQRRARRRGAAKQSFQRALDIFESLLAPLWAAKARAELQRVGIRAPAPLELTPTEERVAELAAAGRTNRQVAEALFLSPKTVEANLARVYRKLGIGSRAELGSSMATRSSRARA
jgi:DNA-binding CsgD family transcriptional regulator